MNTQGNDKTNNTVDNVGNTGNTGGTAGAGGAGVSAVDENNQRRKTIGNKIFVDTMKCICMSLAFYITLGGYTEAVQDFAKVNNTGALASIVPIAHGLVNIVFLGCALMATYVLVNNWFIRRRLKAQRVEEYTEDRNSLAYKIDSLMHTIIIFNCIVWIAANVTQDLMT